MTADARFSGDRGGDRGGDRAGDRPRGGDQPAAAEDRASTDGTPKSLYEVVRFRVIQWTKIFSAYFSAQAGAQLLGIGAGLLFINFMPVREFALYTLAFSVVSFFHFVTDLGSTSSLVYFRRESLDRGEAFGRYVAAVLSLRRGLFLLGAVGVLVAFPFVAARQGFGPARSVLVAAAVAVTVWFQLVSSIRVLVLRLRDRYGQSYRAEVAGGAIRLGLAGFLVVAALLRAWLGVLTAAAASAGVAWVARDRSGRADEEEGDNEDGTPHPSVDLKPYRRRVLRYLAPTLPSALYFSIQGPLVVWLAAAFAGTENIAEVGALGRLGMVVGLFTSLISVVFLPRLAKVTDDRIYRIRYFQFGGFLLAIALAFLAAAALVPELFLMVLGPHYSGLHRELLVLVAASGAGLLDAYAVGINLARSWNRWQGGAVALLAIAQALLIAFVPLDTTINVLLFRLLSTFVGLTVQVAINLTGFVRPAWVKW